VPAEHAEGPKAGVAARDADRSPTVGIRVPYGLFEQDAIDLRRAIARAEAAGIDRLTTGDHVTFHGGQGFDGLLQAAVMAGLTSAMTIQTGVYLIGLRHPVPVARQVTTVAQLAPGRFVFGVGVGGEDRREWVNCGVDPATRGQRVDEALTVVGPLLRGEVVDHAGRFFELSGAQILPTPRHAVPLVIGGRSDAAARRVAMHGDGWIGLFVSPARFGAVTEQIEELAAAGGRHGVAWWHGLHLWCSFDATPDALGTTMSSLYEMPFSRFAPYAPFGSPADVAGYIRPYLDAGCAYVNLAPVSATVEEAIDGVAEVRRLLRS
jgi:alkanesulfonate monooxygenase SsuD/methylene tetrahydromethanopterin reductase-like flavin-dependent oxidoreductase (luciferase family)